MSCLTDIWKPDSSRAVMNQIDAHAVCDNLAAAALRENEKKIVNNLQRQEVYTSSTDSFCVFDLSLSRRSGLFKFSQETMSTSTTKKIGLKRKGTTKPSLPRKKAKIQHRSADDLPWKSVSRPFEAGIGFDDGILDFEEVEGVEVIYETTDGGRVVKFNVSFIHLRTFFAVCCN